MNKKRRRRSDSRTAIEDVVENFTPCGRCSFFLVGYRVLQGNEQLEQAAASSDADWLDLACDRETRQLLQESYGSRFDMGVDYLDGRCPECQRRFIFRSGEQDGGESVLQMELKSV